MLGLDPIRAVLVALFVLLPFAGYVKGCSDERGRFEDFKRAEAAVAKAQEEQTARVIKEQKTAKEKADAENRNARAALERLRRERSRTVYVPAPAPATRRPDLACFDRSALEQAIRRLAERVSGIAAKGDEAAVDLNSARRWAQGAQ